jgi:CHAT domain-containing protein
LADILAHPSRSRDEIKADVEQAEKLGILVMSRENLEQAVTSALVLPNAEQLYDRAIQTIEAAQAKYDSQVPLLPETSSAPI